MFQNPRFRWGIAVFDAALLAAIGYVFVEDVTVQLLVYSLAASALVLTPLVLKRSAHKQ